jgi:hypothetical protein
VEIAKPVVLVVCILSLYAVFYTAFLDPLGDPKQRVWESLALLALAGGVAVVSGLIFREGIEDGYSRHPRPVRLISTLPVRIFCWASGIMLILFLVSWFLERYFVFYRDIRVWV